MMPRKNEFCALIYPAAGVTPARPAIAPVITPVVDTFSVFLLQESTIQTIADVADAICDTNRVLPARGPELSALPALNPNQPNHNMAAPITASGMLCGTVIDDPKFFLRPNTKAARYRTHTCARMNYDSTCKIKNAEMC